MGVAVLNSPVAAVLSGPGEAVGRVAEHLDAVGVRTTRLRVSHAFHSALMEPILDRFADAIAGLEYRPPAIPIISTLTGAAVTAMDAEYWVGQLRNPVRFADAVSAAAQSGATRYLELGPDASLMPHVSATDDRSEVLISALQRRDRDPARTALSALGALYADGAQVNWSTSSPASTRAADLPTYPFQHSRYWLSAKDTPPTSGSAPVAETSRPPAYRPPDTRCWARSSEWRPQDAIVFTGRVSAAEPGWIADHQVLGSVLLPGTAFVELALRTGERSDARS